MAKRRKEKDEEEEIDFKIPKFDEEKFLKKERRNIKTLFISFLFGIVMAVITFGFWTLLQGHFLRWDLVFLLAVVNAVWIKYLFIRLDVDFTDFGKKQWFTTYAIYFFTWLLVFIVIVNPPFYDEDSPKIEAVILPNMQELGGTVNIIAKITDNAGIEQQNIAFSLNGEDIDDFTYENNIFMYTFTNPDNFTGDFDFIITATDVNGYESSINSSFTYSNDTIKLPTPPGTDTPPGPRVTYANTIEFDVGTDVSRVYYTVDGGKEINATLNGDFYETTPEYEGWPKDKAVTVTVYADIIFYFVEPLALQAVIPESIQYNNTIVDTQTYYFNVSGDPTIGSEESPVVGMPLPQFFQVPGFELVVFLISLIAVVLIFKYRKNNRRN